MEVVAIVLAVAAIALAAVTFMRLHGRGGAARAPYPRRRGTPRDDPMAAAVAGHAEAIDPDDVAAEELRLRAQANRVAAAAHERDGGAPGSHPGAGGEERRLEADAHRDAAAEHRRMADELEQRAAQGDLRSPYADPR